jgi:hypothetical protein
MTNNGGRSPDCGDIQMKSKSQEMSLVRLKYTKKKRKLLVQFEMVVVEDQEANGSCDISMGQKW